MISRLAMGQPQQGAPSQTSRSGRRGQIKHCGHKIHMGHRGFDCAAARQAGTGHDKRNTRRAFEQVVFQP